MDNGVVVKESDVVKFVLVVRFFYVRDFRRSSWFLVYFG